MKKIISFFCITMLIISTAVALVGCTDTYECLLSIGDSTVENDAVSVYYVIESEFGNGYSIKGHFRAESQADLDRDFMFTITFDDYLSSGSYSETTLVSCKGSDIKDGKKFNFEIKLDNVAKYFPKTETPVKCYLVLHDDKSDRKGNVIAWNCSEYTYTNANGDKVSIEK